MKKSPNKESKSFIVNLLLSLFIMIAVMLHLFTKGTMLKVLELGLNNVNDITSAYMEAIKSVDQIVSGNA